MIQGILTPHLVPFRADGSIHEGELRRMVNWLIEKGVNGLYPNGTVGEFIRLSFEERKRIVRIVMEENRGRVPVLAGAAEANIGQVIEAARLYADLGCTAITVTGPYYFKVSQDSVEAYFRELARLSPIDILLYNIPQFSTEISIPVIEHLTQDCPRIAGIKDSSRDFPRFCSLVHKLKATRPDFSILIGTEEILLPSLIMGGDGAVIATSGVVPELVMKLYHDFKAGRLEEARHIQFKLLDLIEAMISAPVFPEGVRAAVALRGFDLGSSRQPLSDAEKAELAQLSARLARLLADCGLEETPRAGMQPASGES